MEGINMGDTNHIRWSDTDTYIGPFTYAKDKSRNFAIILGSGDDEDYPGCRLRITAFGHTVITKLPAIIQPWREKIPAPSWDAATVARLGRDWYWSIFEREYGFSYGNGSDLGGGFLQVFLGRQTHDSSTTQSWSCFTPWNNLRHVRRSLYTLDGDLFWTEPTVHHKLGQKTDWDAIRRAEQDCPSAIFKFQDFDGESLTALTRIEEREWRYGTGWFKWLSLFHKPLIKRSLDIQFSGETGKRKGSWKGGTIGHSIAMLPGELHEAAFKRYCAEHEMKYQQTL
jgi:hypothetical protein